MFKPGDHIIWCDEELVVKEDRGSSGTVTYLDGSLCSNDFKWDCLNEKAVLKEEWEQNKILIKAW